MKIVVPGFPRHVGPSPGHLTECLVVDVYESAKWLEDPWPPLNPDFPYCTCEDWSPDQ